MPPRQEAAQFDAAESHLRNGDLEAAERACRRLLRKNRNLLPAWEMIGLIALRRQRLEEAREHYERCFKLRPESAKHALFVARTCTGLGQLEDALEWYDRVLQLEPGSTEALGWKALTLERAGRAEEALQLIAPFLVAGREDADMAKAYVRAKQRAREHEEAVRLARKHIDLAATPPLERRNFAFYAAKSLEKLGRFDEAFETYALANRLLKRKPFDREAFAEEIDAFIATFSRQALEELPAAANTSKRPVFIVGMPRSGTTLVEQIIDAHPRACGVGELTDFEDIAADLPRRCPGTSGYPTCLKRATPQLLTELASRHLRRLHRLSDGAARVVNKNLFNWQHLGLLSRLFPEAYFLDCRRSPLDTCASCYMSELMLGKLPYTADLDDLAYTYRQYERLVEHWHDALDIKILRVQYEDVVANLATRAREIIDFIDLEWVDDCERFHQSKRMVMTLSYEQVQQPIYSSSVGRAEKFGKHFEPLKRALATYARS
jgi:tetratricopeptide (TPR) repeat protein